MELQRLWDSHDVCGLTRPSCFFSWTDLSLGPGHGQPDRPGALWPLQMDHMSVLGTAPHVSQGASSALPLCSYGKEQPGLKGIAPVCLSPVIGKRPCRTALKVSCENCLQLGARSPSCCSQSLWVAGESLPGCVSFPLGKRHTCLWKTLLLWCWTNTDVLLQQC